MDRKITYIFRKPHPAFHSIEEVFGAVIPEVGKHLPVSQMELPYPSGFWGVLKNLATFRKEKHTLYHITGQEYYMALRTGRSSVLTIHDTGSAFSGNPLKDLLIRIFWFWLPALIARRITVISEFSKGELERLVPFAAHKIRVIHNPVNPALEYQPKPFNAERPVILLMGTKPNKNLPRIIAALKDISCHLLIVGKLNDSQLSLLKACKFMEYIDSDPLPPKGGCCSVAPELKSPLGDLGVKSAICNLQSAINSTGHGAQGTEHKSLITNHQSLITNFKDPISNTEYPITNPGNRQPNTEHRTPNTEYRQPATVNRQPSTFTNFHNLPYPAIIRLYQECDLLCFASTYEGFGLPILEAQATGRPVVTSTVASMPEVAGDGACMVDPFSVESIREGVLRVIHDPAYREELVQNGLKNIVRFSPEKIAADYLKVYREMIAGRHFDE